MLTLTLVRGLPGSGKTTLAKSMRIDHFEADQFFMVGDRYVFDPSRLSEAHAWCLRMARNSLEAGRDCVVSNTFSRRWEMAPYFEVADSTGAKVRIIEATGNFKSVHDVPDEVVERMRVRWESAEV